MSRIILRYTCLSKMAFNPKEKTETRHAELLTNEIHHLSTIHVHSTLLTYFRLARGSEQAKWHSDVVDNKATLLAWVKKHSLMQLVLVLITLPVAAPEALGWSPCLGRRGWTGNSAGLLPEEGWSRDACLQRRSFSLCPIPGGRAGWRRRRGWGCLSDSRILERRTWEKKEQDKQKVNIGTDCSNLLGHLFSSLPPSTNLYGCCFLDVYKHFEALIHSSVLPCIFSHFSSCPHTQPEHRAEAAVSRALSWHFAEPRPWRHWLQVQTSSAGLRRWSLTGREIGVKAHGKPQTDSRCFDVL